MPHEAGGLPGHVRLDGPDHEDNDQQRDEDQHDPGGHLHSVAPSDLGLPDHPTGPPRIMRVPVGLHKPVPRRTAPPRVTATGEPT